MPTSRALRPRLTLAVALAASISKAKHSCGKTLVYLGNDVLVGGIGRRDTLIDGRPPSAARLTVSSVQRLG